jgi:hypothetical protein
MSPQASIPAWSLKYDDDLPKQQRGPLAADPCREIGDDSALQTAALRVWLVGGGTKDEFAKLTMRPSNA